MKKLLSLLAILAIAMPAMAASITVNVDTQTTPGSAVISWSGAAPVAFALDIVPAAAAGITAASDLNAYYDVYIDYASAQGASYVYGSGDASSAIAAISAAGLTTLDDAAGFCISMAGLKDDGESDPATSGNLITLAGEGTYTIAANAIRGGIVDAAGACDVTFTVDGVAANSFAFASADPFYVGLTFSNGLVVDQAMVDKWVYLGKPAIWVCDAQKKGNCVFATTSALRVDVQDLAALKASWFKSFNQVGSNSACDFNCSGRVDVADLAILKLKWFQVVGGCN